jgi:hypothetical protein
MTDYRGINQAISDMIYESHMSCAALSPDDFLVVQFRRRLSDGKEVYVDALYKILEPLDGREESVCPFPDYSWMVFDKINNRAKCLSSGHFKSGSPELVAILDNRDEIEDLKDSVSNLFDHSKKV